MIEDDDEPSGRARGGHARREALPPERRSEIAKQAARVRWSAPVSVIEDAETGDQFVLFTNKEGIDFQLKFDGAEPWATQKQIADLLGLKQSNISLQIKKLIRDGEIDPDSNIDKINIAGSDKPVRIYSLDVILAIGFKARATRQAIMFRTWAKDILRRYLISGFVVDMPRLENPDGRPDHFAELLAKVRHIRGSEKRMWTRVLELASFCSDYGMMTDDDRSDFFATIQNAMHWSVTQMTAAETIHTRVDARFDNAGVITFSGEIPTAAEAKVAKNLLGPSEIESLNLVTSMTLEFFESQAEQRRPTTITQFLGKMRELLKLDGRPLIRENNRGSVSMGAAKAKASAEIKSYKERIRIEREIAGENALLQLGERVKRRGKP